MYCLWSCLLCELARGPPQVHVHGVVALRLTPVAPDPSHSQWRPWHGVPMFERHQEDEEWIPPLGSEGREVQAGS